MASPGVPPYQGGYLQLEERRYVRLDARARPLLVLPVKRGRQAQEALPRQDRRPGGHLGRQARNALGLVTGSCVVAMDIGYEALGLRLENAHAAVEAAMVEARRRVHLNEGR